MRVRQAGYGVFTAEDCFIHHFGQGSFSKLPGETYNRIFEANRKRFEEKWKQPWVSHRTRPGVRPAFEERRFEPSGFLLPAPSLPPSHPHPPASRPAADPSAASRPGIPPLPSPGTPGQPLV